MLIRTELQREFRFRSNESVAEFRGVLKYTTRKINDFNDDRIIHLNIVSYNFVRLDPKVLKY